MWMMLMMMMMMMIQVNPSKILLYVCFLCLLYGIFRISFLGSSTPVFAPGVHAQGVPALFPNRTGLQEHFTKQCVDSELIEKIGGPQVIASFTAAKRIWVFIPGSCGSNFQRSSGRLGLLVKFWTCVSWFVSGICRLSARTRKPVGKGAKLLGMHRDALPCFHRRDEPNNHVFRVSRHDATAAAC